MSTPSLHRHVIYTLLFCLSALVTFSSPVYAQDTPNFVTKANVFYLDMPIDKAEELQKKMCVMDIRYPENRPNFPTLVWFHGGGLTGGKRGIPTLPKNDQFAVVGVEYRLIPTVTYEQCLEDAASSVAWVFKHIAELGGDPSRIYISGHSAGGYLAAMVGLDKKWLNKHEIDANQLAGIIPFSGQMTTHFKVRTDQGFTDNHPVLNEYAPLWHIRKDAAPLLLITGDREMEFPGRTEENLLMAKMMKVVGHPNTTMYELQGYGHLMADGGLPILSRWLKEQLKNK